MGKSDREPVSVVHLFPVVFCLVVTLIFASILKLYLIKVTGAEEISTPIIPESVTGQAIPHPTVYGEQGLGPLMNALLLLSLMTVSVTLFYLFVKRGKTLILRLTIMSSFGLLLFALSNFYVQKIQYLLNLSNQTILSVASLIITLIILPSIFVLEGKLQKIVVISVGSSAGTFLGTSIPLLSAIVLILMLMFYDVITVYKGPLGKMLKMEEARTLLKGIVIEFREVIIGLGDIIFYSMVISHIYYNFNAYYLPSTVMASIGILIGTYITLKIVEKRRIAPALPISLALAMILGYGTQAILLRTMI